MKVPTHEVLALLLNDVCCATRLGNFYIGLPTDGI